MKKLLTAICFLQVICSFSQPTTTTIYINTDGYDAEVRNTLPDNNYGGTTLFRAYWDYVPLGTSHLYRSFIYVDLSSIPTNAIITSATLNLYCTSVNNSASHPIYIQRVRNSSWVENTITWNNQPPVTTSDQLSFTHASTSTASAWHTFAVTSHVQYMANYPVLNLGWRIKLQSESGTTDNGITWASSEHGTSGNRPYLSVTYILPIEISGTVIHSSEDQSNGVIDNIVITEGTETYSSYEWFKYSSGTVTSIESGTNMANIGISNLSDGLYLLRVTDNGGYKGYQYFLVGKENATTTVQFSNSNTSNSALFNEDALLQFTVSSSDGTLNQGSSSSFEGRKDATYYIYSLLKYKVHFDPLLTYEQADLYLYSGGHYREAGNSNEGTVKRITSGWYESTVTWDTKPTVTATDAVTIPQTSSSGTVVRNDIVDLLDFVNYWSENPTQNQGVMLEINTAQSGVLKLLYYSYDYATHASRPNLVLTYSFIAPYHELSETPVGSYYKVPTDDILRVKYIEEYLDEDWDLKYNIKNADGDIELDQTSQAHMINYGDNRLRFDVSSLTAGFYTMEVINEKEERWYLRFEVI